MSFFSLDQLYSTPVQYTVQFTRLYKMLKLVCFFLKSSKNKQKIYLYLKDPTKHVI